MQSVLTVWSFLQTILPSVRNFSFARKLDIQGDSKVGAFLSPANRASKNKVFFPLTLFRNMNNNEDTGCQSVTEKIKI